MVVMGRTTMMSMMMRVEHIVVRVLVVVLPGVYVMRSCKSFVVITGGHGNIKRTWNLAGRHHRA